MVRLVVLREGDDDDFPNKLQERLPLGKRTTHGYRRMELLVHRPVWSDSTAASAQLADWGMTLAGSASDGSPVVRSLKPRGLGSRAGVRLYDLIKSIDGVVVRGHREGVNLFDRASGDVQLVIERKADVPVESLCFVLCCAALVAIFLIGSLLFGIHRQMVHQSKDAHQLVSEMDEALSALSQPLAPLLRLGSAFLPSSSPLASLASVASVVSSSSVALAAAGGGP